MVHAQSVVNVIYILSCVCFRVNQAEEEATPVVDVDGSYLYRKYQRLTESGKDVAHPDYPSPPPSGWKVVNENTYKDIAPSIPLVTTGTYIIYVIILCYAT